MKRREFIKQTANVTGAIALTGISSSLITVAQNLTLLRYR